MNCYFEIVFVSHRASIARMICSAHRIDGADRRGNACAHSSLFSQSGRFIILWARASHVDARLRGYSR
jgi:hypothetical protein